jgi:hypothetical protein
VYLKIGACEYEKQGGGGGEFNNYLHVGCMCIFSCTVYLSGRISETGMRKCVNIVQMHIVYNSIYNDKDVYLLVDGGYPADICSLDRGF